MELDSQEHAIKYLHKLIESKKLHLVLITCVSPRQITHAIGLLICL
jgi:hypothetical protein